MTDGCLFCHKPFFDDDDNVVGHDACFEQHTKRINDKECSKCGGTPLSELKDDVWCSNCNASSKFTGYDGSDVS